MISLIYLIQKVIKYFFIRNELKLKNVFKYSNQQQKTFIHKINKLTNIIKRKYITYGFIIRLQKFEIEIII